MKKVDKKSLTYVLPKFIAFHLKAISKELSFRKFTIEDYAWVQETFGKAVEELLQPGQGIQLSTLCRIWFRALSEESKLEFPFSEETRVNDETGEKQVAQFPPWRVFMKSMEPWEIPIVSEAFSITMLSSRPLQEWPEDLKKSLEKARGESLGG